MISRIPHGLRHTESIRTCHHCHWNWPSDLGCGRSQMWASIPHKTGALPKFYDQPLPLPTLKRVRFSLSRIPTSDHHLCQCQCFNHAHRQTILQAPTARSCEKPILSSSHSPQHPALNTIQRRSSRSWLIQGIFPAARLSPPKQTSDPAWLGDLSTPAFPLPLVSLHQ